jgi:hypothetical protein
VKELPQVGLLDLNLSGVNEIKQPGKLDTSPGPSDGVAPSRDNI